MQRRTILSVLIAALSISLGGCKDTKKESEGHARSHVENLAQTVATDVEEIRKGMPEGAKHELLRKLLVKDASREEKAEAAREALSKARDDVQDLRICKATFFAVTGVDGVVIRTDQEVDQMAGKGLLGPFPDLGQVMQGKSVETRGSMPEAAGVKGKPDGQWAVGYPVKDGETVLGAFVTGWSWSKYAYRLEFKLRNDIRAGLGEYDKEPLTYVFLIVDKTVYGAPAAPQVTQDEIGNLDPMSKIEGDAVFSMPLELTGRDFGLAVKGTPVLGPKVGVAVLRSET